MKSLFIVVAAAAVLVLVGNLLVVGSPLVNVSAMVVAIVATFLASK